MKIPIYQIDAFADGPFKGNPAAVCPLDHWLPDTILQCIAEENNLSETAFFVGNAPEYHLRWFTPNTEVDLCGHATLAAAHVIFDLHPLISTITFHSRSGPLRVAKNNSLLTLDFPSQTLESCQAPDILIQALGIVPQACFRGMDYLAVLPNESDIIELTPNFELLKQLDLRGLIVTAPGTDVDFVSRFFAPNCGINEDPVTGSAHCMLAPYWGNRLGKSNLAARQLSKRGGRLHCQLSDDRVLISGNTVCYLQGTIDLDNTLLS